MFKHFWKLVFHLLILLFNINIIIVISLLLEHRCKFLYIFLHPNFLAVLQLIANFIKIFVQNAIFHENVVYFQEIKKDVGQFIWKNALEIFCFTVINSPAKNFFKIVSNYIMILLFSIRDFRNLLFHIRLIKDIIIIYVKYY